MTLQVSSSSRAIARSGHINTLEQVRQSDVGGFPHTCISVRADTRIINNIEHTAGDIETQKPHKLDSIAAYQETKKLIDLLINSVVDYVTIYAPYEEILDDHYYSTSRSLAHEQSDRLAQKACDDLLILMRDKDGIFLTWGNKETRRTAGVGVKVDPDVFENNNHLFGAIYDILEYAAANDQYIDIDMSNYLQNPAVIVQGHGISQGRYALVTIQEFTVKDPVDSTTTAIGATKTPVAAQKEVIQPTEKQEETSIMKTTLSAVIAENKAAAINAGEMETGRLVVNRIVAVVKKRAPMMIKGYIDTPVGRIAVANLFATLVREYMPDNALAGRAADGAVKSAAYEVLRDIDIPAMIEEVLAGFKEAEPAAGEKVAI